MTPKTVQVEFLAHGSDEFIGHGLIAFRTESSTGSRVDARHTIVRATVMVVVDSRWRGRQMALVVGAFPR